MGIRVQLAAAHLRQLGQYHELPRQRDARQQISHLQMSGRTPVMINDSTGAVDNGWSPDR
jgi:hypothetical protein